MALGSSANGPIPLEDIFYGLFYSWTGYEVKNYPPANVASWSPYPEQWPEGVSLGPIGHYTQVPLYTNMRLLYEFPPCYICLQVVWAESKEIGCGYADYGQQVLVCNYSPAGNKVALVGGNIVGRPVYNTDMTASCPKGSTEDDGLCVW